MNNEEALTHLRAGNTLTYTNAADFTLELLLSRDVLGREEFHMSERYLEDVPHWAHTYSRFESAMDDWREEVPANAKVSVIA